MLHLVLNLGDIFKFLKYFFRVENKWKFIMDKYILFYFENN